MTRILPLILVLAVGLLLGGAASTAAEPITTSKHGQVAKKHAKHAKHIKHAKHAQHAQHAQHAKHRHAH